MTSLSITTADLTLADRVVAPGRIMRRVTAFVRLHRYPQRRRAEAAHALVWIARATAHRP